MNESNGNQAARPSFSGTDLDYMAERIARTLSPRAAEMIKPAAAQPSLSMPMSDLDYIADMLAKRLAPSAMPVSDMNTEKTK